MTSSNFTEIKTFSNLQIFNAIKECENELIKLNFKKVSGQSFKSHELKSKKLRLAQLKTLLTERLYFLEKNQIHNLKKSFLNS